MLIPGYPRKLPSAGEDTRGIGGCVFAQLQPSVALFDPPWYFSAASGNKPVAVDVWLKSLAESQQLSPEWFPKPYLCSSFPFFLSFFLADGTQTIPYGDGASRYTNLYHLSERTCPALPCPAPAEILGALRVYHHRKGNRIARSTVGQTRSRSYQLWSNTIQLSSL